MLDLKPNLLKQGYNSVTALVKRGNLGMWSGVHEAMLIKCFCRVSGNTSHIP